MRIEYIGHHSEDSPPPLSHLLETLEKTPLDPRFEDFGNFLVINERGEFYIRGNFWKLSRVFSVRGSIDEPEMLQLAAAVRKNQRTKAYREARKIWDTDESVIFGPLRDPDHARRLAKPFDVTVEGHAFRVNEVVMRGDRPWFYYGATRIDGIVIKRIFEPVKVLGSEYITWTTRRNHENRIEKRVVDNHFVSTQSSQQRV